MDAFDHFVKEVLRQPYYCRYTDDAVIVASTRKELAEILPWIEVWLWRNRQLTLHPKKVEIRKLKQGIDFLGYVTLPNHSVLRRRTKKRMIKGVNNKNISSYWGMLEHCDGFWLQQAIIAHIFSPS